MKNSFDGSGSVEIYKKRKAKKVVFDTCWGKFNGMSFVMVIVSCVLAERSRVWSEGRLWFAKITNGEMGKQRKGGN